jgi:hypothetical protein
LPATETTTRAALLRLIAQLYDEWGKPNEAERYRTLLTGAQPTTRPATIPTSQP